MTVLLCGMIFESAAFRVGSGSYIALTVVLACLIVGVVVAFVGLLGFELWQSIKYSYLVHAGA
jgi:hypothetical protein